MNEIFILVAGILFVGYVFAPLLCSQQHENTDAE